MIIILLFHFISIIIIIINIIYINLFINSFYHNNYYSIFRHRNIPKAISTASKTKRIQIESIKRKEDNLRKHSKKGEVPYVPERKKNFVTLQK